MNIKPVIKLTKLYNSENIHEIEKDIIEQLKKLNHETNRSTLRPIAITGNTGTNQQ